MAPDVHVVCLDAPDPPQYGGAIEMFYKIVALAQAGLRIQLHYFHYKNIRNANALQPYCAAVYAYKRKSIFQTPPFSKPHTVTSRINQNLITRLNADDAPVLLEGIHCTGIVPYLRNQNRAVFIRVHNNEAAYYNRLAQFERNLAKRLYFYLEGKALHRYQKLMAPNASYVALSEADAVAFKLMYKKKNVTVIPAFLPWQQVRSIPGRGTYCLYHGNLAVAENEAAARWLLHAVFANLNMPFVIAGASPSARLKAEVAKQAHVQLVANPTDGQLQNLLTEAQINVLPDFNTTGVKLKVLHALFCGRYCITNGAVTTSATVAVATTADDYMGFIKSFIERPFTEADAGVRANDLQAYNNAKNAAVLSAFLSTHCR